MNRIFSGIQPTGNLHLGNYLGAIRNWVALQHDYECIFCIVDLHALTQPQDPTELRASTREVTAAYISAGIDPERCTIFNQSMVSAHVELAWLLGCLTPLGWLNRMTQFKEKGGKDREMAGLGLYAYPVLMAADILVYKATHVPVGEDQRQHLELAPDVIARKIRRAKTDPEPLSETLTELERRPEADNLIGIYAALSGLSREDALARFAGRNFSYFKEALSEIAVEVMGRMGSEMSRLMEDPGYIDGVLRRGAQRASAIAYPVLREAQAISGLLRP